MQIPLATINKCLVLMLAPFVRLAIRHGLAWRQFYEICRSLYVQEAKEHLKQSGSKVNMMRVSALTGLRREEVKKHFEVNHSPKNFQTVGEKVVGRWMTSKEFLTKSGEPRVLSCKGSNSEFHRLVREVSKNHSPESVKTQLLTTSIVRETKRGLQMITSGYFPEGDPVECLQMLGLDVNDLAYAVQENLFENPELRNLHSTTEYDTLPAEEEEKVRRWLLEEGARFHKRARRFFADLDDGLDRNKVDDGQKRIKVIISTFSRTREAHQEEEQSHQSLSQTAEEQ